MRTLYFWAWVYGIAGLASGLAYREMSKLWELEPGNPLGLMHTHLLALGLLMMLIAMVCDRLFGITQSRAFRWFVITYNAGLIVTVLALAARGIAEATGADPGAALSGIAGLGHMLLAAGIILLLVTLRRALPAAVKA